MSRAVSWRAAGHATSLLLAALFVVCVVWDLLIPSAQMHRVWAPLLPGFVWISWPMFLLGVAESYAYGWLIAAPWVWLYNRFQGGAR